MRTIISIFTLLFFSTSISAQQVQNCFDEANGTSRMGVNAIAEPWEENTRSFANGAVRIVVLDTWDPANYPTHLMVLYVPNDAIEAEGRNCVIISDSDGRGFQNLSLQDMATGYDPAVGLIFTIEAERYDSDNESVRHGALSVILNRATNTVTADFH